MTPHYSKERLRAIFEAARSALPDEEAGRTVDVSRDTMGCARTVLDRGTPEELAQALEGRVGLRPLARVIRQRAPSTLEERSKRVQTRQRSEKQLEDLERRRAYGRVAADLRTALSLLAGLPSVDDVLAALRLSSRSHAAPLKIEAAANFMEEFLEAYTDSSRNPSRPARSRGQDGARDGDAGNGGAVPEPEQEKSAAPLGAC